MADMTTSSELAFDAERGVVGVGRRKEVWPDLVGSVHLPSSSQRARVFGT